MLDKILKSHLDSYYNSLVEYKHVGNRINKIFLEEKEKYNKEESVLHLSSLLILRDWSGKSDNGWAYAYPTDSIISTNKENYSDFINDISSKQFCLMYFQSFEGLEKLVKDFLFELAKVDQELKILIEGKLRKGRIFSRKNMPDGDFLVDIVDKMFDLFLYQNDKVRFDLKTSFYVLSNVRHCIVHNNYVMLKSKIFCSTEKRNLFNYLFIKNDLDSASIKILLDIEKFNTLIDFMSEFAFQILKKICLKYGLDWRLYKNMDVN